MQSLHLSAYTASCAAGHGKDALWQALQQQRSGLRRNDFPHCGLSTHIGRMHGVEDVALPKEFAEWDCRNNRLAWIGLGQDGFLDSVARARDRHGKKRVALVLGTSTASIGSTEEAYRLRENETELPAAYRRPVIHTPHSLTGFVRQYLELEGPFLTVATACSSSARVFASAARLLQAGMADAAVVGGVDSLCLSVLYGFNALELMSPEPCRPFDVLRNGINIGEAAGFALLERESASTLFFEGYGESSDAYHMSSPHPEGLGARQAMEAALQRAELSPDAIDYVNLHGTATRVNDEVEGKAIVGMFPRPVACSSTKAWTGHALGAAGILEAAISALCLERGMIPATLNCTEAEPLLADYVQMENRERTLEHVMSNSFGFGGNNCSLIFGQGMRRG